MGPSERPIPPRTLLGELRKSEIRIQGRSPDPGSELHILGEIRKIRDPDPRVPVKERPISKYKLWGTSGKSKFSGSMDLPAKPARSISAVISWDGFRKSEIRVHGFSSNPPRPENYMLGKISRYSDEPDHICLGGFGDSKSKSKIFVPLSSAWEPKSPDLPDLIEIPINMGTTSQVGRGRITGQAFLFFFLLLGLGLDLPSDGVPLG